MTDRQAIPVPTVYVPQGHVSLKEALVRAAEILRPQEDVRGIVFNDTYLAAVGFDLLREPPEDVSDPFSWPPYPGSTEFDALEEVRERMRYYLAEGNLSAVGQVHDGELEIIKQGFWRTDAGGQALRFPARIKIYTQVFIADEALASFLNDVPHWYSLGRTSGESGQPSSSSELNTLPTSGLARKRCLNWLNDLMASGERLEAKARLKVAAQAKFSGLSGKSFELAWKQAVETTSRDDLSKPGPKPRKSPTPNRSAK